MIVCLYPLELGCRHGGPSLESSVPPSSGINLHSVGRTLNAQWVGSGNLSGRHK